MKYEMENGTVLSDDDLESMAAEWESGEWAEHLENVTMGAPLSNPASGRPSSRG
ncbi:MAG: hypothetical protein V8R08_08840 [Coriobacteriales bacterium]